MKRRMVFLFVAGATVGAVVVQAKPPDTGDGLRCPHFLVGDGDDRDTEPDRVPTTPFRGECHLREDVRGVLQPLQLESGTRLDCEGHQIVPSTPGRPDDPLTTRFDPVFSQPQVLIYLEDVVGVEIRYCQIGPTGAFGFDLGILAVNSKNPQGSGLPRNRIVGNSIRASYVAVDLIAADEFDIEDNHIVYFVQGGAAVHLQYGSQRNTVKSNTIVGDLRSNGALVVPGPTDVDALGQPIPCLQGQLCTNTNPVIRAQAGAIVVTQVLGAHTQLWNAIVGGALHQFTFASSEEVNEEFTADNVIEGNDISFEIASFLQPLAGNPASRQSIRCEP